MTQRESVELSCTTLKIGDWLCMTGRFELNLAFRYTNTTLSYPGLFLHPPKDTNWTFMVPSFLKTLKSTHVFPCCEGEQKSYAQSVHDPQSSRLKKLRGAGVHKLLRAARTDLLPFYTVGPEISEVN
jgi:hypothetical protein